MGSAVWGTTHTPRRSDPPLRFEPEAPKRAAEGSDPLRFEPEAPKRRGGRTWGLVASQVGGGEGRVVEEFGGGAFSVQPAGLQDVGVVGDLQSGQGVLLNQQDRGAL